MSGTIPASQIMQIIPGVLGTGGTGIALNPLVLTANLRLPIGGVYSFGSSAAVGAQFGLNSTEYAAAQVLFAGYEGATQLPAAMLMARYPTSAVPAWLHGGAVASLASITALTGTLTINVNGSPITSASINLSSATSLSNAATIIQAAFTSPPFTVSYDSISGAFWFTTTGAGVSQTIAFPTTNSLATGLKLTQAAGAVLSQGANTGVPGTFMSGIIAITTNWSGFSSTFDPDGGSGNAQKLAFAAWTNAQDSRYAYFPFDNDITATQQGQTGHLGALLAANQYSGTAPFYEPAGTLLFTNIFALAVMASINTNVANGATDFAFRSQSGLTPSVTDAQTALNLEANGYNFYGAYSTATTVGNILYPGQISGEFDWIDEYIEQIWLNANLQQVLFELPQLVVKIPFNQPGATIIEASLIGTPQSPGPIDQAISFGAINPGVTLSSLQVQAVNAAAGGIDAATTLQQRGWYLLVNVPSAQVRQARGPWPILFWYTSGGSVHTINLSSVLVA